jgi:hypothetical protein
MRCCYRFWEQEKTSELKSVQNAQVGKLGKIGLKNPVQNAPEL